jgi:hypothetical protein
MNASIIHEIGFSPTIEALTSELTAVDRLHTDGPDCERLYERHWALRALINASPARTISEMRAKARALQIECARDEDFECHVPGSARELAKSLVEDILMMGAESEALA